MKRDDESGGDNFKYSSQDRGVKYKAGLFTYVSEGPIPCFGIGRSCLQASRVRRYNRAGFLFRCRLGLKTTAIAPLISQNA